jgi:SEC-C motif-containing protein
LAEPTRRDLGRNDPCHCGSGRKYKQCHLAKDEEAERSARAKEVAPAPEAAAEAQKVVPPPAKHATKQPWKGQQNTRGFGKLTIPRRSGGS